MLSILLHTESSHESLPCSKHWTSEMCVLVTSVMFGEDSVECYPHIVSLLKQQSVHFPEVIFAVSPERLLLDGLFT